MYTMTPLPNLPRIVEKREASVTPKILEWFKANYAGSAAIEIKATKGRSIPASALLPHQRRALLGACGNGIVWKIPDEARRQTPFDAFKIEHAGAFVVCVFTSAHVALVIDVREWNGARSDMVNGYVYRVPL